jgi:hypothetical protein
MKNWAREPVRRDFPEPAIPTMKRVLKTLHQKAFRGFSYYPVGLKNFSLPLELFP